MSINSKIFVEGSSDQSFLCHYFNYLNINTENVKFFKLEGKDDSRFIKSNFISKEETNGKNLIIIDADNDNLTERREHIKNLLSNSDEPATAELFFLPNNIAPGNLEELQKSIVLPQFASFFECYDALNNCIPTPHKLNLKDAVYAYQSTLLDKNESEQRANYIGSSPKLMIGERFWNYESPELIPLKEFLLKHLSA